MNFVIRVATRPLNDANGWWRGVAARCSIPRGKEDKGWQKHSSPTPPPHQPGLASPSPAAREPGPGQPGARLRVRKRPSALAHLQVRSRFRPAFPGRKLQGPRMRFPALLLGRERRSTASGDPAPPSQRGTNRTAAGGTFAEAARPRAARGVYRLVGAGGAGARFPLGVGGARASKASTEAAGERAHVPRLPPGWGARARARGGSG